MARRRFKTDPADTEGQAATTTKWFRHEPYTEGIWWITILMPHVFNGDRWRCLAAPAVVDDFGDLVVVGRFG